LAVIQSNKFTAYASLFHVNRAFNAIVAHCYILEKTNMFRPGQMRILRGLTRELQSQISHDIADLMHHIEDGEMYRWEKVRIARERYLKGE
jgi:hypothetical protein